MCDIESRALQNLMEQAKTRVKEINDSELSIGVVSLCSNKNRIGTAGSTDAGSARVISRNNIVYRAVRRVGDP